MSESEIYDLIIVGGGPGGLSAGIYAMRAALKTILIEMGAPRRPSQQLRFCGKLARG